MSNLPHVASIQRPRGRPREFDEAHFLDAAIVLFRRRSFSGVSVSDITQATGVTAGSLYKAYKDKEGVFAKALGRYIDQRRVRLNARLDQADDGRSKVAELLRDYLEVSKGRDGKLGCMLVAGISDLEQLGDVSKALGHQLDQLRAMLEALIGAGHQDRSIPLKVDCRTAASVLLALLQGMRVVAKASTLTVDEEAFVFHALKVLD